MLSTSYIAIVVFLISILFWALTFSSCGMIYVLAMPEKKLLIGSISGCYGRVVFKKGTEVLYFSYYAENNKLPLFLFKHLLESVYFYFL